MAESPLAQARRPLGEKRTSIGQTLATGVRVMGKEEDHKLEADQVTAPKGDGDTAAKVDVELELRHMQHNIISALAAVGR